MRKIALITEVKRKDFIKDIIRTVMEMERENFIWSWLKSDRELRSGKILVHSVKN